MVFCRRIDTQKHLLLEETPLKFWAKLVKKWRHSTKIYKDDLFYDGTNFKYQNVY